MNPAPNDDSRPDDIARHGPTDPNTGQPDHGAEVTELIQGYVIARQLETTEHELMETVFAHPTLSEMMHESTLSAYGRALHF